MSTKGRLQRAGAQRWNQTKRQAVLPSWGPAVGLVLVVVFVLWLVFSMLFGGSGTTATTLPAQNFSGGTTISGGSTQTTVDAGPATHVGTTTGSAKVSVQLIGGGGFASVDASASNTAKAAATAYFTGNWSQVTMAAGTPPTAGSLSANVTLNNEMTGGPGGSGSILFTFEATLDSGSVQLVRVYLVPGSQAGSYLVSSVD